MKLITILSLLITTLFSSTVFAQINTNLKHPKVIEVEMMLTKEAMGFLQQRIQKGQVYVNVDIEPLRREFNQKNEKLPYFYSDDEITDEWDAIDTPLVMLLSRIKKANIKVEVPSTLTDAEISDLKEKLFEQLKLIPVRDSIVIEKKSLAKTAVKEEKDFTLYYYIAGLAIVGFAGLFLSLRFGTRPTTNGNANTTGSPAAANSGAPAPSRSSTSPLASQGFSSAVSSRINGDINFQDSLRAAEMFREKLKTVVSAPMFPTLSDMIILESLLEKRLGSFGAFVSELSMQDQEKVFFRSHSTLWFKGYTEAASIDSDCILAVDKMIRNRIFMNSQEWEELLIQVWRLDAQAPLFLKQLPHEEAYAILASLPKSFAVPAAKKAFPGGWARVLNTNELKPITDKDKVDNYLRMALTIRPYFSFKSIDEYRKDLDLVDYVRLASTRDEEEVYEALSEESHIHQIRPPFYSVFKSKKEDFKFIFSQFELSDWALASFNSPREYLKIITNELDDKKKYLFTSFLNQLDDSSTGLEKQAEIKEVIARRYYQLMMSKKNSSIAEDNQKEEEGHEDKLQAA
jgi:3-methyladenine DNA glycosylase AlkC